MDETIEQLKIGKELPLSYGTGWFKYKWKAIKGETWNFYILKCCSLKKLGISFSYNDNGGTWDEDCAFTNKCFRFGLDLIWIEINFWIKWNFVAIIHKEDKE